MKLDLSDDNVRDWLDEVAYFLPSSPCTHGFFPGVEWGAGWAFAIVGMAQAIRDARICQRCDGELEHGHCGNCDERW
jgi:hypothetical protein